MFERWIFPIALIFCMGVVGAGLALFCHPLMERGLMTRGQFAGILMFVLAPIGFYAVLSQNR